MDDVLIVALFQQVGWKFLENRHNPAAFEPAPTGKEIAKNSEKPTASQAPQSPTVYTIEVEGKAFVVKVSEGGDITHIAPTSAPQAAAPVAAQPVPAASANAEPVKAPMAGTILKVEVAEGQQVAEGDVLLILEAMKMETQICAAKVGVVQGISVKQGDVVAVEQVMMSLA